MSEVSDDGVIRFLDQEGIAAARMRYLEGPLLDWARPVFQQHEEIASLGLWIAQYFCDEAIDATHITTLFSVRQDPVFSGRWEESDINLQGLAIKHQRDLRTGPPVGFPWSETYWCGPLFASFAPEGALQDYSSEPETWGRLGTVRRGAGDLVIELAQTQRRPWLDGVAPIVMADDDPADALREFTIWMDWVCGVPRVCPPEALAMRARLVEVLLQLADVYAQRAEGDWPGFLRDAAEQIAGEGPTPRLLTFFDEVSVPIEFWKFPTDPVMLMRPGNAARDLDFPFLEPDDVTRPLLTEIKALWFELRKAMPIPRALYRV